MFILFGRYKGEAGWDGRVGNDIDVPVALFETLEAGDEYLYNSRLKNPNYSKHEIFKKISVLVGFDQGYVYQKEMDTLSQEIK